MITLLWILTKLKYRGSYIGFLARVTKTKVGPHFRIFRQARVVNCTIGYNTHIGVEAVVRNTDIGDNTGIAERCIVGVYNRKNQRVKIGNNVMIGTGSIVMEGVRIGDNAWVGAGSVIRSNVKRNAVVAGNPAEMIRIRPNNNKIMG